MAQALPRAETLFDQGGSRITAWRAARPARVLVVGVVPAAPGPAEAAFGPAEVLALGHDAALVEEGEGTFLQDLSLDTLADRLGPWARDHDRVVLWGASLGGYGALFYAGALGGLAVALAPRFALHPYLQPHLGPRVARDLADRPRRHPDLARVPASPHNPIVIFDPDEAAGAAFVAQVLAPACPQARLGLLAGAGHRVGQLLAYQGLLAPTLTAIIDTGRLPPIPFDPADRPLADLARAEAALAAGDAHLARSHLLRAAREPHRVEFLTALRRWAEVAGQPFPPLPPEPPRLRQKLARRMQPDPALPPALRLLAAAQLEEALCNFDAAARLAGQALAADPRLAKAARLAARAGRLAPLIRRQDTPG